MVMSLPCLALVPTHRTAGSFVPIVLKIVHGTTLYLIFHSVRQVVTMPLRDTCFAIDLCFPILPCPFKPFISIIATFAIIIKKITFDRISTLISYPPTSLTLHKNRFQKQVTKASAMSWSPLKCEAAPSPMKLPIVRW